MNKSRILIANEETANAELINRILSSGYEIIRAFDEKDVLTRVEKSLPDILLLDTIMRGMNSYEVCRKLKGNEKTISIPIILISNIDNKLNRMMAIQTGADDFMSKPYDIDILCERVKSLIKIKHYHDNSRDKSEPIFSNNEVDNAPNHFNANFFENNIAYKEEIVKSHLEIILLKFLSEKPMCGLDIIKEILNKYNVLMCHGTVYASLYKLKKDGILFAEFERGNMRTKKYSATRDGKITICRKINEFVDMEVNILNSIQNGLVNIKNYYQAQTISASL